MKCRFIPLIVMSVIVLTSMSQCIVDKLDSAIDKAVNLHWYSPVEAEINGDLYMSEYYDRSESGASNDCYPCCEDSTFFYLSRNLYSETGKYMNVSLLGHIDTFKTDSVYIFKCFLGDQCDTLGEVEFTDIQKNSKSGKFEFTITVPETGQTVSTIRNGKFHMKHFSY